MSQMKASHVAARKPTREHKIEYYDASDQKLGGVALLGRWSPKRPSNIAEDPNLDLDFLPVNFNRNWFV